MSGYAAPVDKDQEKGRVAMTKVHSIYSHALIINHSCLSTWKPLRKTFPALLTPPFILTMPPLEPRSSGIAEEMLRHGLQSKRTR